jgi:hypothetical protein
VVNKSEIQVINTAPAVETLHISPTQIQAKLPKITLQKFRGNVTNWNPFWESCKAAVHKNNSISKVDKMNYLFSHLEGAAARSVQRLTLTEANYDAAIAILEERFGRPQQIIAAHMDELLKVQPCSNERSSSIRFVYDKIRVPLPPGACSSLLDRGGGEIRYYGIFALRSFTFVRRSFTFVRMHFHGETAFPQRSDRFVRRRRGGPPYVLALQYTVQDKNKIIPADSAKK